MAKKNNLLSAEILEQFDVVKPFHKQRLSAQYGGGVIDAKTLTVEKAADLVKKGWPYLKPKPKKKKDTD